MEFERINEDTIRVDLTNHDLAERGVSITELMGNQDEIESFFRGLLEEADEDYDFLNKSDGAVSFQVLPKRDGLEVFISTRAPDQAMMEGIMQSVVGNQDEDDAHLNDDVSSDLLKKLLGTDEDESGDSVEKVFEPNTSAAPKNAAIVAEDVPNVAFMRFNDFEDVLGLAQIVGSGLENTRLYEDKGKYYLSLEFANDLKLADRQNLLSVALEYGKVSPLDQAVVAEHGRTILNDHAVDHLNQYFNV
ncbi:adaptor protein MecA [Weissella viridescens]|uniref:adaptor protein MecA n=1 Tax=Weissella viridescens TaxID=1629 RepID=UPI001D077C9E|nr:adaptor protein MecA [Weissella viridescens]MCB6840432.1 adaptor protein MecA [Weissella viridescens]MCB6847165.1 adaptor protein MecA [Weissella viridescens]